MELGSRLLFTYYPQAPDFTGWNSSWTVFSAIFPQDDRSFAPWTPMQWLFSQKLPLKNIFLIMVCVTNNNKHIRQSYRRILRYLTGRKTNIFVNEHIRFTKVRWCPERKTNIFASRSTSSFVIVANKRCLGRVWIIWPIIEFALSALNIPSSK